MTYIADYPATAGVRRVFAFADESIPSEIAVDSDLRWSTPAQIKTLATEGGLTPDDVDALRLWWDEPWLRGIGESPARAKRV